MSKQVIRATVIGSNGVEVSCIGPEPPEGSPVTVGGGTGGGSRGQVCVTNWSATPLPETYRVPSDLDNLLAMLRKTRDTRFSVVGPTTTGGYPDRVDEVTVGRLTFKFDAHGNLTGTKVI